MARRFVLRSADSVLDALDVQLCSVSACALTMDHVVAVPTRCACVYYVSAGGGVLRHGEDEERPLLCGSVVIAAASMNGLRLVPTSPPMSVLCCTVSASLRGVRDVFDALQEPLVQALGDDSRLQEIFGRIALELKDKEAGSGTMVDALITQYLVLILREHFASKEALSNWSLGSIDARLSRAVAAVRRDPAAAHSVSGLACIAGMSRSGFAKHFLRYLQQSPMEFVKQARLRRAADLLRSTDLPVKVIAARSGYASRSHFSRAFHAAYSIEPSRFRTGAHKPLMTSQDSELILR